MYRLSGEAGSFLGFKSFIESFEEKLTRRVKWKRLSFITQFKIEFLLPYTGCRKVLTKMPASKQKTLFKIRNTNLSHA